MMRVDFRVFESSLKSWETLFQEAAEWASQLAPEQLISISHSCDSSEGVVTVWFWDYGNEEGDDEEGDVV